MKCDTSTALKSTTGRALVPILDSTEAVAKKLDRGGSAFHQSGITLVTNRPYVTSDGTQQSNASKGMLALFSAAKDGPQGADIGQVRDEARLAAGRRARQEARALDRLVEAARLTSFRSYLAATVNGMSSIVPDVLSMAGSDARRALGRIRPGHLWPDNTRRRSKPRSPMAAYYNRSLSTPRIGDAVILDGLRDWIEAAIYGESLEVVLRGPGYTLTTHTGTALLKLESLPNTVVEACVGRAIEDVVDHQLLRGRGFVIARAAQVGAATMVSFDVGSLPLQVPCTTAG
jgi:hypothetical protein